MGGLLVKEILRHALTVTSKYRTIATSTKAVVFFATPHTGSSLADIGNYLHYLLRTSVSISELAAHQPRLRDLNLWFRNNFQALNLRLCIFYETQNTGGVRVVNEVSSDPGIANISPIPIDASHISIVKPQSYGDLVVGQTMKLIDEAIPSSEHSYDPDRSMSIESVAPPDARRDVPIDVPTPSRPDFLRQFFGGVFIIVISSVFSYGFGFFAIILADPSLEGGLQRHIGVDALAVLSGLLQTKARFTLALVISFGTAIGLTIDTTMMAYTIHQNSIFQILTDFLQVYFVALITYLLCSSLAKLMRRS